MDTPLVDQFISLYTKFIFVENPSVILKRRLLRRESHLAWLYVLFAAIVFLGFFKFGAYFSAIQVSFLGLIIVGVGVEMTSDGLKVFS